MDDEQLVRNVDDLYPLHWPVIISLVPRPPKKKGKGAPPKVPGLARLREIRYGTVDDLYPYWPVNVSLVP